MESVVEIEMMLIVDLNVPIRIKTVVRVKVVRDIVIYRSERTGSSSITVLLIGLKEQVMYVSRGVFHLLLPVSR